MGDKKIFVGNLPFGVSTGQLEKLFESFGEIVGVNIRKDRMSGKPKGFAFVTFSSSDAVSRAIAGANGKDFQGRTLTVNNADKRGTKGASNGDNSYINQPTKKASMKDMTSWSGPNP